MQTTAPLRECAASMARAHAEMDDGLLSVCRLVSLGDAGEGAEVPIRLLEVSEDAISAGVLPVWFAPNPAGGMPYPLVAIQVSPLEFERVHSGDLALPTGWTLEEEPAWTRQ